MGTRIHVYLTHDLARFDEVAATLARFKPALPAALAVRDYWRRVEEGKFSVRLYEDTWEAEPINPRFGHKRSYTGPGSLFLSVNSAAAHIFTGGRWRGFLSIEPIRRLHLAVFRAIAVSLHSPTLAICHSECQDAADVYLENGTQDDCIAALRKTLGSPQPSVDAVAPDIARRAARGVPDVWYLDEHPASHYPRPRNVDTAA